MKTHTIEAKINGSTEPVTIPSGTPVEDILPSANDAGLPYVGALVNNDAVALQYPVLMSCAVRGLTVADHEGWLIMRRSMCFLLAMAANKVFPEARFRINHSVDSGVFFTLFMSASEQATSDEAIAAVEQEMRALVSENRTISGNEYAYDDAVEIFASKNLPDKLALLRHINTPSVKLMTCNGFYDLYQGPLVNATGLLKTFKLRPYENGCVLQIQDQTEQERVREFKPQPSLMNVHREHAKWGDILGIRDVGQLNQAVFERRMTDVIQLSEALHDKMYAGIAFLIAHRSPRPNIVLIAGPSSAGKTTSAKRLAIHLQINGLHPVTLSTDDYFVGDDENPRDENGELDYEHLEAIDIGMFNEHLSALLDGRTIKRRIFDFKTKSPVITDEELTLRKNDVLIIEGIHGLNPALTSHIPRVSKFLIYLSALTQLGIDNNNILSTSDNRLMRRIVRDHLFRGHSALRTIQLWASVRRGEERWIFPYQDESDVSINTALDYEIAVLRPFVEPLLTEIKPHHPEYTIARRLQGILKNFHPITPSAVPRDSILREYIGGSLLKY